jgi:hypothetical protein
LADKSSDEQLSNLREFGVYDSHQCREDGCERQAGRLGLHNAPAEQAATTDEVLLEQLRDDILDVRHVHSVDDTSDALPQRIPTEALIFIGRLVRSGCLA